MVIGKRKIRGVIREREEAQRIYAEAKRQGYVASLLTQERPNIFTQKVANIEPGKRIDVLITYFYALPHRDGEYDFVFPMVVGPRFNPPGSTDGVAAVRYGKPGRSGQLTEVHYLPPGMRTGHDIAIDIDLEAGVKVENIYSPTHKIRKRRLTESHWQISLAHEKVIPNKDFVLRYRLASERLKIGFLVHKDQTGNYFALYLQPPRELKNLPRIPREMVFVVDCSGSMSGEPLAKAKQAMRRCLANLTPEDTFQIIRFSESASALGNLPLPATAENLQQALLYLNELRASGGTMMITGIRAALSVPSDEQRLRIVSFMTDGYIDNEREILAETKRLIGNARIFSFGIGSSVNRYLLERIARIGRGAVAFVGLDEDAGRKVDLFYRRAARPALVDININWGKMRVKDLYPQPVPDIFVGRPVLLLGRFEGSGENIITISGKTGRQTTNHMLTVNLGKATEHKGIATLWARWRLADLSERECWEREKLPQLKEEMTRISLSHKLLCRYTAFVVVDSTRRTAGSEGYTLPVPVPVPEGVKYETTVEED
jgi:Ca-activated chloride channel family protein